MKFDFTGKTAVVTGGARGIGASLCASLAELGANVAMIDMLETEARNICGNVAAKSGSIRFYKTDVTDMSSVENTMNDVKKLWGRIDILVCCAGIVSTKPCAECTEEDWDRVMNVNAKGIFTCCHSVLPVMMRQRYGKIVNLSSIAAKTGGGFFGNLIYGASKAAVIAYTKGLAREAGPCGVNVNAVCPGPTDTPMIAALAGENRKLIADSILLKRVGEPRELANAILFLVSDFASFITSEVINVDGGIMKGC